jgi:hypothetical protein
VGKIIYVLIAILSMATTTNAQNNSDIIKEFVSDLPRNDWGGALYWLEMRSVVGWEKMILVVGYASNGPVCERLATVAHLDAPAREFRCSAAN